MNGDYYNNDLISSNKSLADDIYIDNILRLNIGKKVKIYVTIPGSSEFTDRIFDGIIESVSRDHIVMSNPGNGEWYLLPIIYIDYIIFEEAINKDVNLY